MLTPDANAETPSLPLMDPNDLDFQKLSLNPDVLYNSPIVSYEQWLLNAKKVVSTHGVADLRTNLSREIEREFVQLQREKAAEWVRQKEHAQLLDCSDELVASMMRPKGSVSIDTGKIFCS